VALSATSSSWKQFGKGSLKKDGQTGFRAGAAKAMDAKPEYVDLISEATPQRRRNTTKRFVAPPVPEPESRLSRWPPEFIRRWRLDNFTPWKLEFWNKFKG
jgi:hypothetical protein